VGGLFASLISFFAYFLGSIAFGVAFLSLYIRMTPHDEFDLIVRQHNASAAIAFGGTMIGFAIALAGVIHNVQSAIEFIIWGFVVLVTQVIAFYLARWAHRDVSHAIENNAIAAALWVASVSISVGIVSAACMSP
jgi:putative membrane protein